MKRLLSAVLVLLVGVVPVAAVANQERVPVEHLLWDIPFGIGVEECLALLKEQVGVELEYLIGTDTRDIYGAYAEQGVTYMNYPVELRATFSVPEDRLLDFEVWISNREKWKFSILDDEDETLLDEGFVRAFREALEINRALGDLYGPPTGGWLHLNEEEGGPSYSYSLPIRNGMLNEALLERVFTGFHQHETGGLVLISYDNVALDISTKTTRSWGTINKYILVTLEYCAWERFNKEWAYSFEGEDGNYPSWNPAEE